MTASIVIPTRNRPQMVQRCLTALAEHVRDSARVVVVDSSDNDETRGVVTQFEDVEFVQFTNGQDQRHQSKNIGAARTDGLIVVFLDDDSMVHDGWLEHLLEPFSDPDVGCVGGGVFEPGTEWNTKEPIGRVLRDGSLSQNFSPDHKETVEVDHVKGCNMSFRRDMFESVGGFDPGYTGDNVREETDVCLGIKQLGKKVVFCPRASVTHARAPREGVSRDLGDPRKVFYNARNHTYLLIKYYRGDFPKMRANYLTSVWQQITYLRPNRELAVRLWLISVHVLGVIAGTCAALTSSRVWKVWRLQR